MSYSKVCCLPPGLYYLKKFSNYVIDSEKGSPNKRPFSKFVARCKAFIVLYFWSSTFSISNMFKAWSRRKTIDGKSSPSSFFPVVIKRDACDFERNSRIFSSCWKCLLFNLANDKSKDVYRSYFKLNFPHWNSRRRRWEGKYFYNDPCLNKTVEGWYEPTFASLSRNAIKHPLHSIWCKMQSLGIAVVVTRKRI